MFSDEMTDNMVATTAEAQVAGFKYYQQIEARGFLASAQR